MQVPDPVQCYFHPKARPPWCLRVVLASGLFLPFEMEKPLHGGWWGEGGGCRCLDGPAQAGSGDQWAGFPTPRGLGPFFLQPQRARGTESSLKEAQAALEILEAHLCIAL